MRAGKKKTGFTLVEILTSIVILGVVMGAVLTLFYSTFESYQFHQDIMEAKQRGHIALTAMQPYISGAALGLSSKKENFERGFAFDDEHNNFSAQKPVFLAGDDDDPTAQFKAPVQLARDGAVVADGTHEGNELWIVYAIPSGIGVEGEFEVNPEARELTLTGKLSVEGDKNTLKSWLVFPAGLSPIFVKSIGVGNKITVLSHITQKVFAFEEAHYLKGVKITAEGNRLYIRQSDGSGNQPVVEGVEAIWLTFDGDGDRVLRATILAKGDTRHSEEYQGTVEGWPNEAPPPKDRHYRYATVTRSWRIRN